MNKVAVFAAAFCLFAGIALADQDGSTCQNAQVLPVNNEIVVDTHDFSTIYINSDGSSRRLLFFTYTGQGKYITLDTCNSGIDTIIYVFNSCNEISCGLGTKVDDVCGSQAKIEFFAVQGKVYYIGVGCYYTDSSDQGMLYLTATESATSVGSVTTIHTTSCNDGPDGPDGPVTPVILDGYQYVLPTAPCSWYVTQECETRDSYYKVEYNVFGLYFSAMTYNKNGELLKGEVIRPDFGMTYGSMYPAPAVLFSYDGQTCSLRTDVPSFSSGYRNIFEYVDDLPVSLDYDHAYFPFLEDDEYNGKDCKVYYSFGYDEDDMLVPDKNQSAMYVDSDGYIIGMVHDAFGDERFVCNFSYGTYVTMSDFTFSKRKVYGCPDERIYDTPKAYYGHCSASTVGAVFSVVVAAIVATFISLF